MIEQDTDAAWLAALILGEGTIQMNNRYVDITISNGDREILAQAERILDGNVSVRLIIDKRPKNWRPCYVLKLVGGYELKVDLLVRLLPYLVGRKRDVAKLALELIRSRLDKQRKRGGKPNHGVPYDEFEKVREEAIRRLNRKGVTV